MITREVSADKSEPVSQELLTPPAIAWNQRKNFIDSADSEKSGFTEILT